MELIDREKLQATIRNMVEIPNEVRVKVLGAVSRAKAADAVEVVRCKDCKCDGECSIQDAMNWTPRPDIGNQFCSYGERRTDG